MDRQDSHSFVMFLFFVIISYHVSGFFYDILLIRSVNAISSHQLSASGGSAKLTCDSPGAPNPNFHKSTGRISATKISGNRESLRVNGDRVSKSNFEIFQKHTLDIKTCGRIIS